MEEEKEDAWHVVWTHCLIMCMFVRAWYKREVVFFTDGGEAVWNDYPELKWEEVPFFYAKRTDESAGLHGTLSQARIDEARRDPRIKCIHLDVGWDSFDYRSVER